jgi:hypothetical protein
VKIDTVRALGTMVTIWLLIGGVFWFLYAALLDPNTATLTPNSEGLIVGACISILTMAAQYVFQSESARSASRSATAAATQGANAALSTPGAPAP